MTFDQPENVARTIWNAVSREAKVVWPGRQERLFVLVQRLFPRLVDRSIAGQLARARRMARTPDRP
jgi:short-subunit dehydrogenase